MTQEDKELLFKDICARLPYGVKVDVSRVEEWKQLTLTPFILSNYYDDIEKIKTYLRPMSSMTEEEKEEYAKFFTIITAKEANFGKWISPTDDIALIDWYNKHHFDYRGLIPMGLALEAPEDMYKTK